MRGSRFWNQIGVFILIIKGGGGGGAEATIYGLLPRT